MSKLSELWMLLVSIQGRLAVTPAPRETISIFNKSIPNTQNSNHLLFESYTLNALHGTNNKSNI